MPSYISRVIAIILLEMSTLKNYRLYNKFSKTMIVMHFVFFKVCPWIQLPFFMLSFFFIPFLMFLEVKKIFPLNWLQVPVTH